MTLAKDFIKDAEGLRLEAYRDGAGVWTIGYGHTGPSVREGLTITAERAEVHLRADMSWALDLIEATVKVQLSESQHAAVTSLIFNIGPGAWKSSTALRRINAGNYAGAADAMTWWNKITVDGKKVVSPGLVNRRERERALFLPDMPAPTERIEPIAHSGVTGGEAKPAHKSKTQWLGFSGVLGAILAAWSQIKTDAPELVEWAIPYLPYIFGAMFLAVMFNRWLESRRGEH